MSKRTQKLKEEQDKIAVDILETFPQKTKENIIKGLKEMQKAGYGNKEFTPDNIAKFFKEKFKTRNESQKTKKG